LKSVSRRIVDRRVLHLIKMWLDCPVEETDDRGRRTRTTEARDKRRGIPLRAHPSRRCWPIYGERQEQRPVWLAETPRQAFRVTDDANRRPERTTKSQRRIAVRISGLSRREKSRSSNRANAAADAALTRKNHSARKSDAEPRGAGLSEAHAMRSFDVTLVALWESGAQV
jgi:hypothetical protein